VAPHAWSPPHNRQWLEDGTHSDGDAGHTGRQPPATQQCNISGGLNGESKGARGSLRATEMGRSSEGENKLFFHFGPRAVRIRAAGARGR
jgi:hypothetical protein